MDKLYEELTDNMRKELDAENDLADLENETEKLKEKINGIRKKGVALLSRISQAGAKIPSPARAGKATKKKLVKSVVCGINGCTYTTTFNAIHMHRKACDGPVGPCTSCGKVCDTPSKQREHNKSCRWNIPIASVRKEAAAARLLPPVLEEEAAVETPDSFASVELDVVDASGEMNFQSSDQPFSS